jgi:hypothetical protein
MSGNLEEVQPAEKVESRDDNKFMGNNASPHVTSPGQSRHVATFQQTVFISTTIAGHLFPIILFGSGVPPSALWLR